MGFTERTFSVGQDLSAVENMANGDTLHFLGIYSPKSDDLFQVEATKYAGENPCYALSWQTHIGDAGRAAELLDKADEIKGLDAHKGTFIVVGDEVIECDWNTELADDSLDMAELDLEQAGLVRLEAERATLVWAIASILHSSNRMGIITSENLRSLWVSEVVNKTASEPVKTALSNAMGPIALRLAEFARLPFGEPLSLEQEKR